MAPGAFLVLMKTARDFTGSAKWILVPICLGDASLPMRFEHPDDNFLTFLGASCLVCVEARLLEAVLGPCPHNQLLEAYSNG